MATQAQKAFTMAALRHDIAEQAAGTDAAEYVYWVMVPAAEQQLAETGNFKVHTPAGHYDMHDVINHAPTVARTMAAAQ